MSQRNPCETRYMTERNIAKIAEVYKAIFESQPWLSDSQNKEDCKRILEYPDEAKKVVIFHMNMLLRKLNLTHTITCN